MWDSKRDTDVRNRLLDTVGEGKDGWFERIALKHVYYHMWNRSPVQVQCMRHGAQGWYNGMTQKDGMGRKVGGGFRMGNTCTPMADSCQCMAKTTTIFWSNSVQFSSVTQSFLTLCNPMNCSMPGLPVHHQLPEFIQTHVHRVSDAISHLILCCPFSLLPSIFPSIRVFCNELASCIRWPKRWSFSFSISPSNEYYYKAAHFQVLGIWM